MRSRCAPFAAGASSSGTTSSSPRPLPCVQRRSWTLVAGLLAASSFVGPTRRADAKIVVPKRKPAASYEERRRRIEEAQRLREEKEAEDEAAQGPLVTLASGIQYRDVTVGDGGRRGDGEAIAGAVCDIEYVAYRLAPGAYFKYSSGGTPIYLFSLGYGNEGKDDAGDTFRFKLGDRSAVPTAVALGIVGMRAGGVRRVLVPPYLGWAGEGGADLKMVSDPIRFRRPTHRPTHAPSHPTTPLIAIGGILTVTITRLPLCVRLRLRIAATGHVWGATPVGEPQGGAAVGRH